MIQKDNQFLRETRFHREKCKKVFNYLEKEKNHIIYFDTSGCIICLSNNGFLYETSLDSVSSLMINQEYSRKEIEYSGLVKLYCNLNFLNDMNVRLRKMKCIFHRILRLKLRKKNFRISKKKEKLFEILYQLKNMELIK